MPNGTLTADDNIVEYLTRHENTSILRFITCGSVDDGKSTLIGRLLYDSHLLFEDQLETLERDSKREGTQSGDIDFALLVDGLAAEREQGITIDVAYRFFATATRKFIVADTPGHEQYTRNMATGASTADLAILMVDARKGIVTQTRRHAFIVSSLGIRNFVLCINKMDLIGYDQSVYNNVVAQFNAFAAELATDLNVVTIPVSALKGDNITTASDHTPWYSGPPLLQHLNTVRVDDQRAQLPFRMPVQWVNRPNQDFRGFSGQIISGSIKPGDDIRLLPSGLISTVKNIVTMDGDLPSAEAGQSVTITLTDEIACSRGDVITAASAPAQVSDQFQVRLLWMSDGPMLPGRRYILRIGSNSVRVTVNQPKHTIDVNTFAKRPAKTLSLNEIGVTTLSCDQSIAFDPYSTIKEMGGFILIDRMSNDTVAMGLIDFALRRADNIHWQAMEIDKKALSDLKDQKPLVLWFTGLSGSGKSTIANAVQKRLHAQGKHTFSLDGDNVRHGLNRDLGFAPHDRVENIRRVAHVAKLMTDAGLVVLVSFISPYRSERAMARNLMANGEFVEIFVDTPLEEAEKRDSKGLYAKARAGKLKNFTGIDSPYEPPLSPDIHIKTATMSAMEAAEFILDTLKSNGQIDLDI